MIYVVLMLLFLPGVVFGACLPFVWATLATVLYTIALSRTMIAFGRHRFAQMPRAEIRRHADELADAAKGPSK